MIKFIPDSVETALSNLCEFIEDCEYTKLSVRILHLLGVQGPKSQQPSKFIRFIYNRVILENAIVRAAAVSSLAKFGVNGDAKMKSSIQVLLTRCLDDVDDEVRDRAAMYLRTMKEPVLAEAYLKEGPIYSLASLETKLVAYIKDTEAYATPFDVTTIPRVSREQAQQEAARPSSLDTVSVPSTSKIQASIPAAPSAAEAQSAYASQLAAVPEFASYGSVINSSIKPTPLTESETEYVVSCVKHIFKEHVVFQFNVSNTLPETILEQVSVVMQPSSDSPLKEDFIIPIPELRSSSPGIVYVSFTRLEPEEYSLASFACTLKFVSKEVDPSSGEPEEEGYDDEYQLEEVELGAGGDYIVPSYATFANEWDQLRAKATATETFSLGAMDGIKAACDSLVEVLNMEPLGGSEHPTSTSIHTLQLSGLIPGGGGKVLTRARMTYSSGQGVTLELGVAAESDAACRLVISAIGG